MRRLALLGVLLLMVVSSPAARADRQGGPPPRIDGSLEQIEITDQAPGSASSPSTVPQAGSTSNVVSIPSCGSDGMYVCYEPAACTSGQNEGILYDVLVDGELVSQNCVTDTQPDAGPPVITPAQVERAFRRLSWEPSPLVIQPPNGRTLINFDTNFYTDNAAPQTQTVTLLGQAITIEATPDSYTWVFGDGNQATTTDPGAPYPALDITHRYGQADTYQPSVATTYVGRYRLGSGPWTTIPAPLTVAGDPVTLEAVEARPQLVRY